MYQSLERHVGEFRPQILSIDDHTHVLLSLLCLPEVGVRIGGDSTRAGKEALKLAQRRGHPPAQG
jgi:hypothetical protein